MSVSCSNLKSKICASSLGIAVGHKHHAEICGIICESVIFYFKEFYDQIIRNNNMINPNKIELPIIFAAFIYCSFVLISNFVVLYFCVVRDWLLKTVRQ